MGKGERAPPSLHHIPLVVSGRNEKDAKKRLIYILMTTSSSEEVLVGWARRGGGREGVDKQDKIDGLQGEAKQACVCMFVYLLVIKQVCAVGGLSYVV